MRFIVDKNVSCALIVSLTMATSSWARDLDEQVNFSIPPQKLDSALVEFSKQAKLQIVSSGVEIMDVSSAGATGSLTIYDALMRLLQSSGLSFRAIGDSAISIGRFKEGARTSAGAADRSARTLNALVQFDIQEQPLAQALMDLSMQSGLTVVAPSSLTMGKKGAQVRGDMSAEDALRRVLRGSGLTFIQWEDGTIAIQAQAAALRFGNEGLVQTSEGEANLEKGSADYEKLEEIVVTAQKRKERLQDVPISISVLTGDDLDKSRAQGLTEILNRVPGVAAPIGALGAPQLVIRGVTATGLLLTGSSTAGYYLDSMPYGFVRSAIVPDASVYDLERVEVLRGPQGTLFGASAQSGVVRILTHDPELDAFGLKASALTSETKYGDWNYRGDMAVNVPLVKDKLAVRAVAGYQDRSGWIDKPGNDNADDATISNMRLKVKAQPSEQLSVVASAWRARYSADAQSIGDDNGNNSAPIDEPVNTDSDAYALKLDYDFSRFSVTSASSYLEYKIASDLDLGRFGLPVQSAIFASDVFSQEFTFTSRSQGVWRWSAGGSYRDVKDRFFRGLGGVPATDYTDSSESWAAFGELTRLFLDGKFELTAGLRYFEDEQGLREAISSLGNSSAPLVRSSASFNATTPRVALTWHPASDLTVYASYAEGFRSGLMQNPEILATNPEFPTLKADTLRSYEVGAKGSAWDRRISFDTAVFFLDWEKVQQNLNVDFNGVQLSALVNSNSASGIGFEFATTIAPVDRLELTANFSWNDLQFDSDVISGGNVVFLKGARLVYSPEYTVGASADYSFPLRSGFKGQLSASGNFISKLEDNSRPGGLPRLVNNDGDSILVTRVSFALRTPDNWTATLFVDNLNNETGATINNVDVPDFAGRNTRPRTIGLQIDYRF